MNEKLIRVFGRRRSLILLLAIFILNYVYFSGKIIEDPLLDVVVVQSAWTENILMQPSSAGLVYSILIYILPSLSLSDVFVEDRETGYENIALLKKSPRTYVKENFVWNFIFGGLFLLMPVLVNLIIMLMIRPTWQMNYINSGLYNGMLFGHVFVSYTCLFYLLHFLKMFLAGGTIASFMMYINTKFSNKYIGMVAFIFLDLAFAILAAYLSNIDPGLYFASFVEFIKEFKIYNLGISLGLYGLIFLLAVLYFKKYADNLKL